MSVFAKDYQLFELPNFGSEEMMRKNDCGQSRPPGRVATVHY